MGRGPITSWRFQGFINMPDESWTTAGGLGESEARFIGISNTLAGIEDYARQGQLVPDTIKGSVQKILLRRVSRRRAVDADAVKLLRISWQTELAARALDIVSEDRDDKLRAALMRISAQTLPVQVYYAVFNAARAQSILVGSPCSTHRQVHDDFFTNRARWAPGPWGVTFVGDPERLPTCLTEPRLTIDLSFNTLRRGLPAQNYLGAALRMTRRWQLDEQRTVWLKDGRNRSKRGESYKVLPSRGRQEILQRLRPTTLMDFVYHMRCRSNYKSSDEYGSDADDFAIARFTNGLHYLLGSGLLLYETEIAKLIGSSEFGRLCDAWMADAGRRMSGAMQAFQARRRIILDEMRAQNL